MRNVTPPSARHRVAAKLRYWLSLPTLVLALNAPAQAQTKGSVAAKPGPCNTPASLIASQTTLCQGGSAVLTIDEGCGSPTVAYTNTWAPDHDISSTTGRQVVVNPLVTTTYQVTGTAAGGATRVLSVTITVQANCCQYSPARIPPNVVELNNDYDDMGGGTTSTPTDPFYGRPAGTYFHVQGTLTLSNGNYLMPAGSVLLMEPNANVVVEDSRLTLNGSTITAACNDMWGQLTIPDDSYGVVAIPVGTMHSRIMHSQGGLVVEGKSSPGPMRLQVDFLDFLHNYQSMSLNFDPLPAASDDYVTHCVFDSDPALMKAPYKATGTDYWYTGQHLGLVGDMTAANFKGNTLSHALLGINLIDTAAVPPGLVVEGCQFSDLYLAGITSGHQALSAQPGYSLAVNGSQFTFPKEAALPATSQVSQTLAAYPFTLHPNETVGIGAQGVPLTLTASTFVQPDPSPYATFSYASYRPRQVGVASFRLALARDNTFQALAVGLSQSLSGGTTEVRGNLFTACQKGLDLVGSSGTAYVSCNTFTRGVGAGTRSGLSYGIYNERNSAVTLANPVLGSDQTLKNLFYDVGAGVAGFNAVYNDNSSFLLAYKSYNNYNAQYSVLMGANVAYVNSGRDSRNDPVCHDEGYFNSGIQQRSVNQPSAGSVKPQLSQNAPNPTSERTTFEYRVPASAHQAVLLISRGTDGRLIKQQPLALAASSYDLDLRDWQPGLYFCTLVTDGVPGPTPADCWFVKC